MRRTVHRSTHSIVRAVKASRWPITRHAPAAGANSPRRSGEPWYDRGGCRNPRLDIDVINCDPAVTNRDSSELCAPENINVDNPPFDQPYRIMVNYFSSHSYSGPTQPTVNIYCDGQLRGVFGEGDVTLTRGDGASEGSNDSWLVADVMFVVDECGDIVCKVKPLNRVMREAGSDFGLPWSF